MNKSESILRLEVLGLNTLNYFITEDPREITHYLAKHIDDYMSLRTERGSEFHCPFYYMIKGRDLLDKALRHLDEGYKIIVSPSLDTRGCRVFGTAGYLEDGSGVIEYVASEGKVRELDNHPDKKTFIIQPPKLVPISTKEVGDSDLARILNTLYKEGYERAYDFVPCVLEWSYYDRPVGRLSHHDIWWELRGWETPIRSK